MSLSSRLIDAYEDRKLPLPEGIQSPFRRPPHLALPRSSTPQARSGQRDNNFGMMDPDASWMSNHGQQSFMGPSSTQGTSSWSEERIQMLQARLARKLGPEYVTQRPGPGGGPKLSYIEGWKVINLANEVFGFNGWSSSIVSLKTDYLDEKEGGRVSVNVTAIIRITLLDGCSHEDVGCGQGENIRGKSAALDKAQKEAVTDATKRALRTFGNVLGNCLYDKEYTKEVVKMRVPPAKFTHDNLERRAEFTPAGAAGSSAIPAQPKPPIPVQQPQPIRAPIREPPIIAPGTPLRSINDPQVDVFMEENFDAEFLDIGSDSFLDQLEETNLQAGPANGNGPSMGRPQPRNAQAGPSRLNPKISDEPTYQHRHRPDPTNNLQNGNQPNRLQEKRNVISSTSQNEKEDQPGKIGSKPSSGTSAGSGSGGSATTLPEAPKPRPVGGFALPAVSGGGNANTAAATARRQAIADALNVIVAPASPPTRAESPKIPSGGIDTVAARATIKLKSEGINLKLEESGYSDNGENVTLGGFASARGVKRLGDQDRRSASPTKPIPNSGQGQGYNRQGVRTALGELSAGQGGGEQDDWAAKRSRFG
ncbi:uncharacterized protein IL334_003860 [Kwoniella shivajii]|uniref:DNA repair and recombination protein RAD52 n=1 Tax=Kwoniella shivajii TaxID=564305 RepID=A0ABZ1CYR5_9TREE|nr:hypothetical protein IL334_003860 [Kwoniella shivajii]